MRIPLTLCSISLIAAGCAPSEQSTPPQPEGTIVDSVARWDSMLGLVIGTEYGGCLTTAPDVTPSDTVTVITLPDHRVVTAAITGTSETCPGDTSRAEGVSFRLTSPDFGAGEIGVAVLVNSPAIIDRQTDLDENGERESFRLCTSHEGVHVTAWTGDHMRRRVWHRYHYLGYDVEPNCTDAETVGT